MKYECITVWALPYRKVIGIWTSTNSAFIAYIFKGQGIKNVYHEG